MEQKAEWPSTTSKFDRRGTIIDGGQEEGHSMKKLILMHPE